MNEIINIKNKKAIEIVKQKSICYAEQIDNDEIKSAIITLRLYNDHYPIIESSWDVELEDK